MSENPWEKTYQVAVVVRDLDAAVEHYERLGIGPFVDGPSASTLRREVRGMDSPDTRVAGKVAPMGPIELELMSPSDGPSIQREFLETHGEGVIHICAYTDDLDAEITRMERMGHPVISYGELDDGGRFAYFDTTQVGGLILEFFQVGSSWK